MDLSGCSDNSVNIKDGIIRGVIFDMDGVIFDSETVWKQGFEKANEKFSLNLTEADRQKCCGKDENTIRKELKEEYPSLDVDVYRNFIIDYVNETLKNSGAPLKDGFKELTDYLKSHGYRSALATSSRRQRALSMFEKKGFDTDSLFGGATFGEDVKVSKPNPEIFLISAEKIGLSPSECIVLEDSESGITAALRGCFKAVMVKDLIEPTPEIEEQCLFIADSLFDVLNYLKKGELE